MAYRRQQLRQIGVVSAHELRQLPNNKPAVAAGAVITRQRPGTAKGPHFPNARGRNLARQYHREA
jgi:hypothetical protein